MKSLILASFVMIAVAFALPARAELDRDARAILHDIRTGRDNANQIQTLRVQGDAVLPSGSIETGEIEDGTLVNADISSSAAIALSKIGAVSQADTNATTTTSGYTSAAAGQLLFGADGSSTRVWRASAAASTTNWVLVIRGN